MRESFYSERVREKAIALADVQSDSMAADIGAGTGFITEGLIGKGLQVIAVDQSTAMLAEMKRKLDGIDTIDYCVGEAEKLPLPDETVHYVFANMFLHHVEQPAKTIKEMARILKPGGKLVITDTDEHPFEFLREAHHDRWRGFKRDEIRQWFLQAGFQNVTIDSVGENCCASSECGSGFSGISIFVALGEK